VRCPDLELHSARVGDETEPHEPCPQYFIARRLNVTCLSADLGRLFTRLLGGIDDVVDVALFARKLAVDGIGAGNVAGEALIIGRRIHEQEIPRLHLAAGLPVMKDGGVGSAADDRGIPPAHRAVAQIDFLDRCFDLVLIFARTGGTHASAMSFTRNLNALAKNVLFVRRLDLPQLCENRRRILNREAEKAFAEF
jgi:hypothetical protein